MSIFAIVPIEVFMDNRLSKTDARVLGAILSFRNKETNLCWPKREQIAERCRLSLPKISTSTTHLVELGWLEKEGNGGRSRSASYKLKIPDLETKTVPESGTVPKTVTVPESGTKTVPESGTKTVPESGTRIKQTNEQTNEQTILMRKLEKSFSNFWECYPKKKSKEQAKKAWLKIKPDEQLQKTIIDAVILAKTQDEDWIKQNGKFIPYPATYLNGKRWNDEITKISSNEKPSYQQRGNIDECFTKDYWDAVESA